jgi:hypothetical protein
MQLSIEIMSDRRWSYAFAATRRPIIKSIVVNQSGDLLEKDLLIFPRVSFNFPLPEKVADIWEGRKIPLDSRGERIGESVHWEKIDSVVNYALLGRLAEKVSGVVVVEIIDANSNEVLSRAEQSLELLAPNEVRFEPGNSEVFAAFVIPSDPFVAEILRKAREILGVKTGDTSTEGYQSGPERASLIAQAIYEAMSSYKYAYSNPQGYFEQAQKVRTPTQIKSENCGTCLDTTVLMAACFAQAGLEPVLFLVNGHAFAGYFTGKKADASKSIDENIRYFTNQWGSVLSKQNNFGVIQQLLLENYIQPVETTTTTSGLYSSFHEACMSQNNFDVKTCSTLESVVMVSTAWKSGITPPVSLLDVPLHGFAIPNLVDQLNENENENEYGVELNDDEIELVDHSISPDEKAIPPRVRQWMASLLNLGANNPLLKIKTKQMMEFDLPGDALGRLDDLLYTPKKKIQILGCSSLPYEWTHNGVTSEDFSKWCGSEIRLVFPSFTGMNGIHRKAEEELKRIRSGDEDLSLSDAEIIKRLREFQLNQMDAKLAKSISGIGKKFSEVFLMTGTNSLYLALGTIAWSESTSNRGNNKAKDFCAPLYLYPVILEGGKGSPYTIRLDPNGDATPNYCLHEKLKRAPYNLDLQELVNPEYDEKGLNFDKMFKVIAKRFENAKLDNFALQPRAVLGVFDYSTFRLWKDLKDGWKKMAEVSPVVKHLTETANIPFSGGEVTPDPRLEPHMPIAADDSQKQAVQWALDGLSFRLEGPPGTGKSQTITNLLASCIANNRKVLFVAEKQTALNAVKDRLDANGLGKYTLNLHAKGDSDAKIRKNISDSLTSALNQQVDPEDQKWADIAFKLKSEESAIDQYRESLHVVGESGFSVWSANEELIQVEGDQNLNLPPQFVDNFAANWKVLREVALEIELALELVPNPADHMWRFSGNKDFEDIDRVELTETIKSVQSLVDDFDKSAPGLIDDLCELDRTKLQLTSDIIAVYVDGWLKEIQSLRNFTRSSDSTYRSKLLNQTPVFDEVDQIIAEIKEAQEVIRRLGDLIPEGFFQRKDLNLIKQQVDDLKRALNDPNLIEVRENWRFLVIRAESLQKKYGFSDFDLQILEQLSQAIEEFSSRDSLEKFSQLNSKARDLQVKASKHSFNVKLELLQRSDLVNVKTLLVDAEEAGVISKKRKSRELRDLLGAQALVAENRLLFPSLRELLHIADEMISLKRELIDLFPTSLIDGLRIWESNDIDSLNSVFKANREKSVRELINDHDLQSTDSFLIEKAKALQSFLEMARDSNSLFDRLLPGLSVESYSPWIKDAGELLLERACKPAVDALVSSGLDFTGFTIDAFAEVLSQLLSIVEREDQLYNILSVKLLPGLNKVIRIWSPADLDDFEEVVNNLRTLNEQSSDADLEYVESLIRSGADLSLIPTVFSLFDEMTHFRELLKSNEEAFSHWVGGRNLSAVVRDCFPSFGRDAGAHNNYLELQRWIRLSQSIDKLSAMGFGEISQKVLQLQFEVQTMLSDIRCSALSEALRSRILAGNLDRFDRKIHERRIATFEAALKESQKLLNNRIPGLIVARRNMRRLPTGKDAGATQDLLRGLKPSRGEKTPIRELVTKYGKALTEVMPCFLMSPDSVATLIPVGSIDFDLVIFDEASQVRTSHAVGALGRGRAGIVVGDSRQMPPSNTFSSNSGAFIEDEDESDEFDDAPDFDGDEESSVLIPKPVAARDAESILTEFDESRFPELQLLCHYRSKDELLISFSNSYIYEEPMLTFPSIAGDDSTALRYVHIPDGKFVREKSAPNYKFKNGELKSLRTNHQEAEAIVKEILVRLRDPQRIQRRINDPNHTAESIIVVTFNIQQMYLISELFRSLDSDLFDVATNPTRLDDESEREFPPQVKIRNLENVQGDEAETVIFSVAFSKTENGKFPMNWGPVTAIGGDRRLNVAVTRAQHEMIVFASFLPNEMQTGNKTLSPNAKMVYNFLRLAHEGPKKSGDLGIAVKRSEHIEQIARELRERGLETQTQLGLSALRVDIAVRKPDSTTWTVAIMVDDTCWSERGSAFQRELLPRQVLPMLGWRQVIRIWLPDWLRDKEEVLVGIERYFAGDETAIEPEKVDLLTLSSAEKSAARETITIVSSGSTQVAEQSFTEFVPYVVKPKARLDLLAQVTKGDQSAIRELSSLFDEILNTEAPIEWERFGKLVCNSLGYGRVVPDRLYQVLSFIPKKQIVEDAIGSFVWNRYQNEKSWITYRTSINEAARDHNEICVSEYANALVDVVHRSHSIGREEALKSISEIFGFKRITAQIRNSIELGMKKAVRQRRVVIVDGEYRPVESP